MMQKEKKRRFFMAKKFWVATVVVLGLAGYLYYRFSYSKGASVEKTEVKRGQVEERLVLSGEIKADEYAKLSFPTSGEISWVGVKEGDEVKKGQDLTKLNTIVLNATYQQSRASLRAAEATVQNVHDQVKNHSGDETYAQKDSRTTAEVAKDKAYEAFISAEYNLRNATLTAPFSGIVTSLSHPFPGVNVLSTETQVEVLNPKTMYFDVSADQSEVMKLVLGQDVKIILDSISDEEIPGKIVFIGYTPKAGEVGTIYEIKVAIDQQLDIKKYRIGMTGDAVFVTAKKDNVLYLPQMFIKSDPNGNYVKRSSKNDKTYIEVGLEGEDSTEIISGEIKEGNTVYD